VEERPPEQYRLEFHAGRLYVTNQAGETFIFKTGPRFELVAKNTIAEPVMASLAVSGGELFLRSHRHLWCIAETR
jgi:hypothetical protein